MSVQDHGIDLSSPKTLIMLASYPYVHSLFIVLYLLCASFSSLQRLALPRFE